MTRNCYLVCLRAFPCYNSDDHCAPSFDTLIVTTSTAQILVWKGRLQLLRIVDWLGKHDWLIFQAITLASCTRRLAYGPIMQMQRYSPSPYPLPAFSLCPSTILSQIGTFGSPIPIAINPNRKPIWHSRPLAATTSGKREGLLPGTGIIFRPFVHTMQLCVHKDVMESVLKLISKALLIQYLVLMKY